MKESSFGFGPDRHLTGTLLEAGDARLAVVLLNAGIIHRVGPHRLNVKIARRLSELGVPSLRFDLSGLGDSRPSRATVPWEQQAVDDLRAAVSCVIARTAARRVAIVGFCSGADNGYAAALADNRIAGLLMLDPYIYPTLKAVVLRYAKRMREHGAVSAIGQWAGRRAEAARAVIAGWWQEDRADAPVRYSRAAPPKADFAGGMQSLVKRGVYIRIIYTGGARDYYNYAGQFADAFAGHGFLPKVQTSFEPAYDHMITETAEQARFVDAVAQWACELAASVAAHSDDRRATGEQDA